MSARKLKFLMLTMSCCILAIEGGGSLIEAGVDNVAITAR